MINDKPITIEDIEVQRAKWARGELEPVPRFEAKPLVVTPGEHETIKNRAADGDAQAIMMLQYMRRHEGK